MFERWEIFSTLLLFVSVLVKGLHNDADSVLLNTGGFEMQFPPRYLSGSIHYFRVRPEDWRDRIRKLKWAGFNAVQTYIEWSSHEPEEDVFKFHDEVNIERFLEIIHEEGLFAILRPGPYICSEREMGGLPYWLLRVHPTVRLRSSDRKFMHYVERWMDVLLPRLQPYLWTNGGPIIGLQVENEYGNCQNCDFTYLSQLSALFRKHLGNETFLFSTDNGVSKSLKCGKSSFSYATVDFGPEADIKSEFGAQRLFEPVGPLINSEFYQGWLDHWGKPHATKSSQKIVSSLRKQLQMGASVNLYMFHGGTNFGLTSGSNLDGPSGDFLSCPTSYDYDAPLNEAGDPTRKYFDLRAVAAQFFPVPVGPPPPPSPKYAYGKVELAPLYSVLDVVPLLPKVFSKRPLTFEELHVSSGIVVYQTCVEGRLTSPAILDLYGLHDRGYVFVNQQFMGIVSRGATVTRVPILSSTKHTSFSILVESQGRIGAGPQLKDHKGLTTTPLINEKVMTGWNMTVVPLDLDNLRTLVRKRNLDLLSKVGKESSKFKSTCTHSRQMFFQESFKVPTKDSFPMDTFLKLDGWSKGYAWINSFLLGRYWPVMGPQQTLYVPHGILQTGSNTVTILELECFRNENGSIASRINEIPGSRYIVEFVDDPIIDGPTPAIDGRINFSRKGTTN